MCCGLAIDVESRSTASCGSRIRNGVLHSCLLLVAGPSIQILALFLDRFQEAGLDLIEQFHGRRMA